MQGSLLSCWIPSPRCEGFKKPKVSKWEGDLDRKNRVLNVSLWIARLPGGNASVWMTILAWNASLVFSSAKFMGMLGTSCVTQALYPGLPLGRMDIEDSGCRPNSTFCTLPGTLGSGSPSQRWGPSPESSASADHYFPACSLPFVTPRIMSLCKCYI